MKEYKKCTAIDRITSQMLLEWDNEVTEEMFIVKKQIMFRCPKTDELVQQDKCLKCNHFYGWSSEKWIYCLPNNERSVGIRSRRKKDVQSK